MTKKVQEGAGEENDESSVKDRGKVFNVAEFERIEQVGDTQSTSSNFGLIASAGKPAPKDSNEDAALSPHVWQSDLNQNSSARRLALTEKTQKVIDKDWPHNYQISPQWLGT